MAYYFVHYRYVLVVHTIDLTAFLRLLEWYVVIIPDNCSLWYVTSVFICISFMFSECTLYLDFVRVFRKLLQHYFIVSRCQRLQQLLNHSQWIQKLHTLHNKSQKKCLFSNSTFMWLEKFNNYSSCEYVSKVLLKNKINIFERFVTH